MDTAARKHSNMFCVVMLLLYSAGWYCILKKKDIHILIYFSNHQYTFARARSWATATWHQASTASNTELEPPSASWRELWDSVVSFSLTLLCCPSFSKQKQNKKTQKKSTTCWCLQLWSSSSRSNVQVNAVRRARRWRRTPWCRHNDPFVLFFVSCEDFLDVSRKACTFKRVA